MDRLELIRFLQIAQTITVHHGALACLLGINAVWPMLSGSPDSTSCANCAKKARGMLALRKSEVP